MENNLTFKINDSIPTLNIGKVGENLRKTINFDLAEWTAEFGDGGSIVLLVRRNGDQTAYPAKTLIKNDILSWNITNTDLAKPGIGEIEIIKYSYDGKVIKSKTIRFIVENSMVQGSESPNPYEDIIQDIVNKINEVNELKSKILEMTVSSEYGENLEVNKIETDTGIRLEFVIPKGERGMQGPPGIQGIQGVPGEPFSIYKTYESIELMEADSGNIPEGKFVMIVNDVEQEDNARVYIKNSSGLSFVVDMSGARGIQGPQGPQGTQGKQGIPGPQGIQGGYFLPSVNSAGVLSWTNTAGVENPGSVDIKQIVLNSIQRAEGGEY